MKYNKDFSLLKKPSWFKRLYLKYKPIKNKDDLIIILCWIYYKIYLYSKPKLNFYKYIKTKPQTNWYLKYYIEDLVMWLIVDIECNKVNLTDYEIQKIKQEIALGASPTNSIEIWERNKIK